LFVSWLGNGLDPMSQMERTINGVCPRHGIEVNLKKNKKKSTK